MGNLSKLFILFLSGNQLTGVIPNSFNDLQQLVVLDLSYNRLEGSLPASMGNLPNLGIIYLSNNKEEIFDLEGLLIQERILKKGEVLYSCDYEVEYKQQ